MWWRLSAWAATRAATGWMLAIGLAGTGSLWYIYDHRGDEIADLKLQLSECSGSSTQAEAIRSLTERINEAASEKTEDEITALRELEDACYRLDDISPLNRVRQP